jgi:hypothetical protein
MPRRTRKVRASYRLDKLTRPCIYCGAPVEIKGSSRFVVDNWLYIPAYHRTCEVMDMLRSGRRLQEQYCQEVR